MILLIIFAFLSGLVTIIAPCIWPLLPIVFSTSSASAGSKRPLGITLGIMLSFTLFTLTLSSLVRLFHVDANITRLLAVFVISFFGITMVFPYLSSMIEAKLTRLSGLLNQKRQYKNNGFITGFITGLSLGVIWSPCAGPILAAITSLAATGRVTTNVLLITIAYVFGIGIPLFGFAYGSQKVITKSRLLSSYTGKIQQYFGVIMIIMAIAIYYNYDIFLESQLLNIFPQLSTTLSGLENNSIVKKQIDSLKGSMQNSLTNNSDELLNANIKASDFIGITNWLNTEKPISLSDLKGKVVLVDFWTYTCINCLRTLPFTTNWYEKYKNQGFTIIGVHTPEFEFEKNTNNVQKAIDMYKINYPVAQDNNYVVWNNYQNEYWPAEYLIDANGIIRRTHFGEGEYDQTELAIKALLKEAGKKINTALVNQPDETPITPLSPETYLGTKRMAYYFPGGTTQNGTRTYTETVNLPQNSFSLGGNWTINTENSVTGNNAVLNYNFSAGKVFLVIRPGLAGTDAKLAVFLDGKPVDTTNSGSDVRSGIVNIDSDRLYNLIDLKGKTGNHLLRLKFQKPGTEVYAFTFG
jgi:cytochrome c biogenesis protein CcdA/thiol-disulfide isomerase/thioredoxin